MVSAKVRAWTCEGCGPDAVAARWMARTSAAGGTAVTVAERAGMKVRLEGRAAGRASTPGDIRIGRHRDARAFMVRASGRQAGVRVRALGSGRTSLTQEPIRHRWAYASAPSEVRARRNRPDRW